MKRIITICFLLSSLIFLGQKKESVKGSKILKAEIKPVESFESLEVEDNLEIFLVKGNDTSIEIEADDNLHEFIEHKLVGNILRISTLRNISGFKKLSVRVTYTDKLNLVISKDETTVTALADVVLENITFKSYDYSKLYLNAKSKNFTLMANDKSKVELNLKSEKAAIDASKSAYVKALISSVSMRFDLYQKASAEIEGDVTDLKLRLDNNSDFIGTKLTAKNATLETLGSSKGIVYITSIASIDAGGSSEIQLFGEPKIEIKRFADTAILKKKQLVK